MISPCIEVEGKFFCPGELKMTSCRRSKRLQEKNKADEELQNSSVRYQTKLYDTKSHNFMKLR